ncbi:putative virion structural protein [Erwinia phage vB_EamM_Caitlin]|uniref:putative virion structural protein n=1 Tax=Erwinia phage vB_EamM_Caitlin TaxID=1883379 RepID=UPI00081CA134|nr:putative virion structural protein [Erwinia phage vB_EamM_Caitlin]ANZ48453.1 putative virion structural protein [Erwinia phage vB_EamM_Caitlin]
MSLKLSWDNANVVPNSVAIYRGDAELNTAALPAPLVVLTNGEKTWTDQTAEFGKTYYYILGTRTDVDEVFTANQKILVADNRGVGPSVLKFGDDNLGYYGTVLGADFVGYGHLQAVSAVALAAAAWNPAWHKFVRNGKIIYVPDSFVPQFFTWQQIYQAGFVYGIDATGPAGVNLTGLTPTNQKRVIDFKGQKYMVRLMRGWGDEDLSTFVSTQMTSNDHDVTANAKNNEFNDFIYSLSSFVPLRQRTENFAENILDKWLNAPYNAGYNDSNQVRESNRGRIMCQERQNPGSGVATPVLIRGLRATAYASLPSYAKGNLSYCAMMGGTQELMWVPVLELIEDGVTL